MDPEEKKLHIKLAYGYYQDKEYKKAMQLYKKLHESDPGDFNIINMIGDTYIKGKNPQKAVEFFLKGISVLEDQGQYVKIIKTAKKAARLNIEKDRVDAKLKNALRLMIRDAEKHVLNKEFEKAREIYEFLQEFNSEEIPINIKLKELNDEESRHKTHEIKMKQSEKQEPEGGQQNELISKFEKMAENYINNGDYDGAVETYITALKLSPNNEKLRAKLHNVYRIVAGRSSGDNVWEKVDTTQKNRVEEAKKTAVEEKNKEIMAKEEERARKLLEEEAKIQAEYEKKEMEIIQAAASELKNKLADAKKKEQIKEDEIQRIMKEQEEKKRSLLEKIKQEAVEKFKKQKEEMTAEIKKREENKPQPKAPGPETQEKIPAEKAAGEKKKTGLFDALKGAYAAPEIGKKTEVQGDGEKEKKQLEQRMAEMKDEIRKKQEEAGKIETEKKADETPLEKSSSYADTREKKAEPRIIERDASDIEKNIPGSKFEDLINEKPENAKDDMEVNDDTLDSLITTAYIYLNQGLLKEALHIYNKVSEKYPGHPEAQQILQEVTKRGGV
ncbi:MAG: tetratricopeptide repeat protein [Candidatus Goldiibacteriota bacterium]